MHFFTVFSTTLLLCAGMVASAPVPVANASPLLPESDTNVNAKAGNIYSDLVTHTNQVVEADLLAGLDH
ncbi:hypothetical protein BDZ91DRAFT_725639 [Kalaharituber pfeilii]|nr:hypothetical protein BDZ91DRAFT_725639 [Kalaharituber pfeilii]